MSLENLVHINRSSSDQTAAIDAPRKGVYIKTFGCQMNEYDSQKLLRILDNKYVPVENPEDADLILVNTCSVREKPEHKLFSQLGSYKPLKAKKDVLIGVGGCVAQQEGQSIIDRSPLVDFVFGTHNLSLVPSLIERRRQSGNPQVAVDYRDEWEELPLGLSDDPILAQDGTPWRRASVFVSISRGCNKNCTYCIVPTTRGPEVSRSPDEVLREVKIAAHRGAKEVVLLGQTVNSYGLDLDPRLKFTALLERIAEVDGIQRIRFTSPHPQEVRADFMELCATHPKVCKHIHMPLQAGSDRILKAMNRNYRKARYLKIIDELRSRIPEISITTDLIVGFPGETRAEFEETLEMMERCAFDHSYSFVFSPRPGTVAENLEDPVPVAEKIRWLQELQVLQEQLSAKSLAAFVGQEVEVLVDGFSKHDRRKLQGRNSQNVMLNFRSELVGIGPGDLVKAKVLGAARFSLQGELAT
jgi:tRNA-2-methylthio-N6-dimethylallyladenosine synthase